MCMSIILHWSMIVFNCSSVQIDSLNKSLESQLTKKVADDFHKILQSLPSEDKQKFSSIANGKSEADVDIQQLGLPRQHRSHSLELAHQPLSGRLQRVAHSTSSLHVPVASNTVAHSLSTTSNGNVIGSNTVNNYATKPLDLSKQMAHLEAIEKSMMEFIASTDGDEGQQRDSYAHSRVLREVVSASSSGFGILLVLLS